MALPTAPRRVVYNPPAPAPQNNTQPTLNQPLGTADWLRFPEGGQPMFKYGDLWLSRLPNGKDIGFIDDRNALLVAGARYGKGASFIIPNICRWTGSLVVIDPKGENAIVMARRRANGSPFCQGMGQKVRILDPFGVVRTSLDDFADLKTGFNPLDMLDVNDERSPGSIDRAAEED